MLHAPVGEIGGTGLLVDDVVAGLFGLVLLSALDYSALLQSGDDLVDPAVLVRGFVGRAADDQRRAGLVDQDRVDLVHDRVVVPALDHGAQRELHVVPQKVEAELVVGAVGDIGSVRLATLLIVHVVLDAAEAHPQKAIDPAHPLRIATGQIVVDRHDMDPIAAQCVEIHRKRGHQGLALAGLHLGDRPLMQDHPAEELDVEVAHRHRAPPCLTHHGEGLGE